MLDSIPYLSFDTINYHARKLLADFQEDALRRPTRVDIEGLVEVHLHHIGVAFRVGQHHEMGPVEAWTDFAGVSTEIVLREDLYAALYGDLEERLRARATLSHEVGHVVLHADLSHVLADGRLVLHDDVGGSRFGCEEWQAWAFAGCLMMPVPMVQELAEITPHNVARVFDVSPQFARRHLWRMRNCGLL